MLTNFNPILATAKQQGFAVGSFNVYSYETIRGVIDAASKSDSTGVIIAFGKKYLENMSLDEVSALVHAAANRTTVPVCLHLDHCDDMDVIRNAIQAGFTSVMYDGSNLAFDQNVVRTQEVCALAHQSGVSVEAELGSIAAGAKSHEGSHSDREIYTDPDQAAEFVSRTGVDALAVSIGTVHGLYNGEPRIRFDILDAIQKRVDIPLVLHGGSGIPAEAIAEAIRKGICKINVNTEISAHCVEKLADLLRTDVHPHLSVLGLRQQQYVRDVVTKYIRFFQMEL